MLFTIYPRQRKKNLGGGGVDTRHTHDCRTKFASSKKKTHTHIHTRRNAHQKKKRGWFLKIHDSTTTRLARLILVDLPFCVCSPIPWMSVYIRERIYNGNSKVWYEDIAKRWYRRTTSL